jgi:hypothetical protein
MTKRFISRSAIWLVCGAVSAAWAQQTPPPEAPDVGPMFTLQAPPPENLNKIGLNYRMGLNISVDFRRLGGLALSDPGSVNGTTVNRNYDNGYNRVDSTGNNHGGFIGTWNWSYQNQNSFQGDHLVLQSYATPANASSTGHQDDPYHGLELTYSRELLRGKGWRAGLEAGFGWTPISVTDSSALHNKAFRTNDTYFGPGVEAWPTPPGPATFTGPGAVINAAPSGSIPGASGRTTDSLPGAALITGSRELNADLFLLRLGPYVEVPLSDKFSVIFSGGLALGVAHSEFSFHNEQVVITDPTFLNAPLSLSQTRSGSGSETDFLVGGYVGGSLSYALTRELSLLVGAQFQAQGQSVTDAKSKQGILDLGQSVFVTFGASYSF